jgi:anti-sigma factor RsiW
MTPIEDWEISGYLDGELPAGRREEVRRAIAETDRLHHEYVQIAAFDAELKALAEATAFSPYISLPARAATNRLRVFQLACGLVFLRVVLKLLPSALSVALGIVLMAALLVWGIQYLLRLAEEDCGQIAGAAAADSR